MKEAFAASTIPVILGNGATSCRLAWRLYLTLGTVCLRLGSRRRFSDLIGLPCTFRKVSADERLLCEQLLDIAEEFDGYLLLLIPSDKHSLRPIDGHREVLETRYIISAPDNLRSHLPCLNQNERHPLL